MTLTCAADDGTMTSITGDQGSVVFTPANEDSYLYENIGCQAAKTNGLNALSFYVLGPAGGEINVEIQTSASCSESNYTSFYYTITNLTGSDQTVVIPLELFTRSKQATVSGTALNARLAKSYWILESNHAEGLWETK